MKKKWSFLGLLIMSVILLSGCKMSVYLTDKADEFEITEYNPEVKTEEIAEMYSKVNGNLVDTELSQSQKNVINQKNSDMSSFLDMDTSNRDNVIECYNNGFKYSITSQQKEKYGEVDGMTQNMLDALEKSLEMDVRMFEELEYEGTINFLMDYTKAKIDKATNIVYVPTINFSYVRNIEDKSIGSYVDESVSSVEEYAEMKFSAEEYSNIYSQYQNALNKYKEAEGKCIVLKKGLTAMNLNTNEVYIPSILDYWLDFDYTKKFDVEVEERPKKKSYKNSEWAKPYIDDLFDMELLEENSFSDYTKVITREEYVELMVRLYEKEKGVIKYSQSENPFKDTNNPDIIKAYKVGLTQGISATQFDPNGSLTREQCAAFASRYIGKAESINVANYNDDGNISS